MALLIQLKKLDGTEFYLNADKILSVHPVWRETQESTRENPDPDTVLGSVIYHEPYNSENGLDWENVKDTPVEIQGRINDQALSQRHMN